MGTAAELGGHAAGLVRIRTGLRSTATRNAIHRSTLRGTDLGCILVKVDAPQLFIHAEPDDHDDGDQKKERQQAEESGLHPFRVNVGHARGSRRGIGEHNTNQCNKIHERSARHYIGSNARKQVTLEHSIDDMDRDNTAGQLKVFGRPYPLLFFDRCCEPAT